MLSLQTVLPDTLELLKTSPKDIAAMKVNAVMGSPTYAVHVPTN